MAGTLSVLEGIGNNQDNRWRLTVGEERGDPFSSQEILLFTKSWTRGEASRKGCLQPGEAMREAAGEGGGALRLIVGGRG